MRGLGVKLTIIIFSVIIGVSNVGRTIPVALLSACVGYTVGSFSVYMDRVLDRITKEK